MLQRKFYARLLQWKEQEQGRTAILIEGARRVGKSYIAKAFAENEYKSYLLLDFANISPDIKNMIVHESSDLNLFFAKLSAFYGVRLYERESIIIFDEVQQFPPARQLIKYLVADRRYDYIETGSLISLRKNIENIVIPSEEERLQMFPLDFEEFLWALGDMVTMDFIRECFTEKKPLGQALHRKIMNLYRQYILVGGMPQSVLSYLENKDFETTDRIKRRILQLYRDDVTKFAAGYEERVFSVFDEIPAQLSKKEKKYNLSALGKNARYREYDSAFLWLKEAMITNTCFNATDPNVGLALSREHTTQKCYMADTGLLVTQCFMDDDFTENELYKAVLFDKININQGMLMENVVAQELRARGHKLYFYSRSDSKSRENTMEIDFLIKKGKKICPVEVKSSVYNRHVSLDKFMKKFSDKLGTAYILYTKDVMVKDDIVHLPLYMAMLL